MSLFFSSLMFAISFHIPAWRSGATTLFDVPARQANMLRQGGKHSPLVRGWGVNISIFWKTPDIGLAPYSIIPLLYDRSIDPLYIDWRGSKSLVKHKAVLEGSSSGSQREVAEFMTHDFVEVSGHNL